MNDTDQASQLKRALIALKTMRSKLEAMDRARKEPIAIIGMGVRVPGATDLDSYWNMLRQGVDAVSEVPADRWPIDDFYNPDPEAAGKMYTRWGGFLDRTDLFEPQFFGITPREAVGMDPQQRLLLEVSWEALEHAGQIPQKLSGSSTGVFLGISSTDYGTLGIKSGLLASIDAYSGTGTVNSVASGRLSYLLGLRGPNFPVDTACSSSLVALHLACQSLRLGECQMAIAGGVNVLLLPEATVFFSKLRAMAADGRCKTFDAAADGYVRGEGCGIVILKRLTDALANRDNIVAVVRGSAVNHDGRSNGLTAPNGHAQEAVIRQALASADLDPSLVGYVEAHGTGTPLGDPIEVQALANVLGQRDRDKPFLLGSVKTNIGHLEASAGVAGLIKVVLSLQKGEIPPHLHLKKPNPYIPWDEIPVEIPTEVRPWPVRGGRRIAGISSFGFSGTNAHVIVEEGPVVEREEEENPRPVQLVMISARSGEALKEVAGRYVGSVEKERLADVAWTLNTGRTHFKHRLGVVAADGRELAEKLEQWREGKQPRGVKQEEVRSGRRARVGMLFSGQGSQYVGMGKQLYEGCERFRATLDRANRIVEEEVGESLLDVMFGRRGGLEQTEWTQPAVYAVGYGLAELWRSWGVEAAGVMGHSVGEYVAAAVAGVMDWEDGLRVVTRRGRQMQRLGPGGAMAAVSAGAAEVEEELGRYKGRVTIAAVNAPESVVISGDEEGVDEIAEEMRRRGKRAERLAVSHAFHSQRMEPMLAELEAEMGKLKLKDADRLMVLNVTGEEGKGEVKEAGYWRRQARGRVEFEKGVRRLAEEVEVLVEVGPTPVLLGIGRQSVEEEGKQKWLATLRRGRGDWEQMLETAAELYTAGIELDWGAVEGTKAKYRRKLPLPTYPFERKRYWMDIPQNTKLGSARSDEMPVLHPLLGAKLRCAVKQTIFESRLSRANPSFLAEHCIYDTAVVPATAYLELALAAANYGLGRGLFVVEQLLISEAIALRDDKEALVQVVLQANAGDASFEILSLDSAGAVPEIWKSHATGIIRRLDEKRLPSNRLEDARHRCSEGMPVADFYERLREHGLVYGSRFTGIEKLWRGPREAVGMLGVPSALVNEIADYFVHPAYLDACLQLFAFAVASDQSQELYLPVHLVRAEIRRKLDCSFWCHVQLGVQSGETIVATFELFDLTGETIGLIEGLTFKRATQRALLGTDRHASHDWVYRVEWKNSERPSRVESASGAWLILADRTGVGEGIGRRVQERGGAVTVIADDRSLSLEQSVQLALTGFTRSTTKVLNLWALDDSIGDCRASALALGLIQQVAKLRTSDVELCFVTRGAAAAGADGVSAPEQAPLWGLARALVMEQPNLRCVRLDLDPSWDAAPATDAILEELLTGDRETEVAFRNGDRWLPRLVRAAATVGTPAPVIDSQGAYLITGGLGSIGLELVHWLVRNGARHLILFGRTGPSATAALRLDDLTRRGIQISIVRGDVASQKDLANALMTISDTTPLRGVIHAAGILDDGILLQQNWSRFETVFRPKVIGSWNLHELTQHMPLDFFVMFSSIASVMGSPGQANYAAANAFLDALAHYRHKRGLKALSINWGPWANTGMAAIASGQGRWAIQGIVPIPPDEGLQILGALLRNDSAQCSVMSIKWPQLVHRLEVLGDPPLLSDLLAEERIRATLDAGASTERTLLMQLADTPPHRRRTVLVSYLREQVRRTLGLNSDHHLDSRQSLLEIGVDSLMATELRNRIQVAVGKPVAVTAVFDFPTIETLADYLSEQILHLNISVAASQENAVPLDEERRSTMVNEIKQLSDDELVRSIAAELDALKKDTRA